MFKPRTSRAEAQIQDFRTDSRADSQPKRDAEALPTIPTAERAGLWASPYALWVIAPILIVALIVFGIETYKQLHPHGNGTARIDGSKPGSLALKVTRNGNDFEVSWNRSSDAVREGSRGSLTIQDGQYTRTVQLDAAQLREGSFLYSALFRELSFKLDVITPSHAVQTETVVVLGWDARQPVDLPPPAASVAVGIPPPAPKKAPADLPTATRRREFDPSAPSERAKNSIGYALQQSSDSFRPQAANVVDAEPESRALKTSTISETTIQQPLAPSGTGAPVAVSVLPAPTHESSVAARDKDSNSSLIISPTPTSSNSSSLQRAPLAPTDLRAVSISATEAVLTWTNQAPDATAISVEVQMPDSLRFVLGPALTLNNTAVTRVGEVSGRITNLQPNLTYAFRVRAQNLAGFSVYSNQTTVTLTSRLGRQP